MAPNAMAVRVGMEISRRRRERTRQFFSPWRDGLLAAVALGRASPSEPKSPARPSLPFPRNWICRGLAGQGAVGRLLTLSHKVAAVGLIATGAHCVWTSHLRAVTSPQASGCCGRTDMVHPFRVTTLPHGATRGQP